MKVNNLQKKIPEAAALIQINQYNTNGDSLEKKVEDVDQKLSVTSGLVTTGVLNTKTSRKQQQKKNYDKSVFIFVELSSFFIKSQSQLLN